MLAAGGGGSFSPPPSVSVFYSPHQDDESLFMALAIANRVAAGDTVYVVCMTQGSTSAIFGLLNGTGGVCSWHGVTHNFGLSSGQFIAARDAEFAAACGVLSATNETAASRPDSGALTQAFAESTMRAYATLYPNARHATISWRDVHPDHIACGNALKALVTANDVPTTRAKFYLRNEQQAGNAGTMEDNALAATAIAALEEYKVYVPGSGRYGIGYHSVPTLMDAQLAGPFNKWHTAEQNP